MVVEIATPNVCGSTHEWLTTMDARNERNDKLNSGLTGVFFSFPAIFSTPKSNRLNNFSYNLFEEHLEDWVVSAPVSKLATNTLAMFCA